MEHAESASHGSSGAATSRATCSLAVLVTYHDEGALLTECLQSLAAQSQPVAEIIVYDDASTLPAENYVPSGMNVRVVRGDQNVGPGAGRNRLLKISSAEYIHWHDTDDFFFPSWVVRIVRAIDDEAPDAVFTNVARYRDGTPVDDGCIDFSPLRAGEDIVRFCIREAILPSMGTYRRAAVEAIEGYRPGLWLAEDYDFGIRLAASGISYSVIDEPLVRMNLRAESRGRDRLRSRNDTVLSLEHLAVELSPEYYPDLSEAAAQVAGALYQLGDYRSARRSFRLARRLAPPRYADRRLTYRAIARTFGPMAAEHVARAHRGLRRLARPAVTEA